MSKKSAYRKKPQEDIACCPCIKIKVNDIDGLEKEAQYRISYDNKNIDAERSDMNLYIHGLDDSNIPIINSEKYEVPLKKRILNLIEKNGAKIREDKIKTIDGKTPKDTKESVVAEGIVFQLSHPLAMKLLEEDGLLDETGKIKKGARLEKSHKTYKYFEDTYLFACKKWNRARIVGAYIHLDEYTPHMHLFVVPLIKKVRKYAEKVILDSNGKPIKRVSLSAKIIFSRKRVKGLWREYGEAMKKYGATVAIGLGEKGTYDQHASMEAMVDKEKAEWEATKTGMTAEVDSLKRQIKSVEQRLLEKDEELRKKEKEISKLDILIRSYLLYYEKLISSLQSIFDKVFGKGKATVLDYDVIEDEKKVTDYYGKESIYNEYQYTISYSVGFDNRLLKVSKNDYYESKDPLKRAVSSLFVQKQQAAIDAKNAHNLAELKNVGVGVFPTK